MFLNLQSDPALDWHMNKTHHAHLTYSHVLPQARKALADRQKDLELKTQQLEIKLSSKIEEDIKKARRKSTQAGQCSFSKTFEPSISVDTFLLNVTQLWEQSFRNMRDYRIINEHLNTPAELKIFHRCIQSIRPPNYKIYKAYSHKMLQIQKLTQIKHAMS